MKKTIENLTKMNGKVYVYLKNAEIAEKFLRDAQNEGFTFGDGEKPTNHHYSDIIAVNKDKTLNYVGAIGRIAYGSGADKIGNEKLIRIDYEKYLENKNCCVD